MPKCSLLKFRIGTTTMPCDDSASEVMSDPDVSPSVKSVGREVCFWWMSNDWTLYHLTVCVQ